MSDDGARRTPLHDDHVAAGARMVEFAGWAMPVQYRGILAEHEAVRTRAGIFDVSHMGEVEITGPRAAEFCARLFTNDVRTLEVGRAQYSMIANDEGGVVDDIIVYRPDEGRFLVCVNASNAAKDLAWMRERAIDGATITDRSDETGLVALQGPGAAALVAPLAPAAATLARFGCAAMDVAGVPCLVARTGYTGEDGFEFFCPAGSVRRLWQALLAAGGADGPDPRVVRCGLGARDTLRIEAALPLYGHELGPDISPYEAGLGWAVKLNRPDMVGHEALSRHAGGRAPRRLVGLLVEGGIAREGAPVFEAGSDRPVGRVTSGTHSPSLGRAVALALVEAATAAGSSALEVELRGKRRAALVTRLPFCVKRAAS